jgi:hypothetical protein
MAGFAASGLVPFNPDRVLRGIPKPSTELTIPKAVEADVGPCLREEVLRTPVTPVSSEALKSLQSLIIKQDAHALDETSKQNLQRHVQKLVNAAQTSFVKGALQRTQIRFLTTINNEAKVRRSTKSVVLGKAKVMSYEDLVAKRAEREAKDQSIAEGKRKRGRKRKSPSEADALDLSKGKRGQKRKIPREVGALEPQAKVVRLNKVPKPAMVKQRG